MRKAILAEHLLAAAILFREVEILAVQAGSAMIMELVVVEGAESVAWEALEAAEKERPESEVAAVVLEVVQISETAWERLLVGL